ncbi:hypothetical protein [Streptomyces venezuelae]|uniref:hypothetical protein n=1 Tax=Streptomyces venezuelae TaxID=54571 RepID=UPI00332B19F2
MNTVNSLDSVLAAGQIDALGDSLIETLRTWADAGLMAVLTIVVVVTVAQKVSIKAGIGALIAMVIALGIYNSRTELSNMVKNEVTSSSTPAKSSGPVTVVVTPDASPKGEGQ